MGDVTKREQEVRDQPADTSEVPIDDVPDQPSLPVQTQSKESQPIQDDRQEVLDDKSVSTGRSKDREAPSSADTSDYKESTMKESTNPDAEELENLPDEATLTLQSATIDCNSENYNMNFPPSPGERQRPIRNASRDTAMLPLIPSSNPGRADIEEFNAATRPEITSSTRGRASS